MSTYGLRVVSSDGVTVIIDGESNMFKIAATGTTSQTVTAGTFNQIVTTTLSGLGALATTPAHLSYISDTNTTAGQQILGMAVSQGQLWGAPSSGASPTTRFTPFHVVMRAATYLDGSSFCVHQLKSSNSDVSDITWYCRYYILQETAL